MGAAGKKKWNKGHHYDPPSATSKQYPAGHWTNINSKIQLATLATPNKGLLKWEGVSVASKLHDSDDERPPEPRVVVKRTPKYSAAKDEPKVAAAPNGGVVPSSYASVTAIHPTTTVGTPKDTINPADARARPTLQTLPDDILIPILHLLLTHHAPLPVTPRFHHTRSSSPRSYLDPERHSAPPCNYSILHTCSRIYHLGLPIYYGYNTFCIDLGEFRKMPTTLANWPCRIDQEYAFNCVKTIVLRCARWWGNWEASTRLLREFKKLESVIIDTRDGSNTMWWDWATVAYESVETCEKEYPGLMSPLSHIETDDEVSARIYEAKGRNAFPDTRRGFGGRRIGGRVGDGASEGDLSTVKRRIWYGDRDALFIYPAEQMIKDAILGDGVSVKDDQIMMATTQDFRSTGDSRPELVCAAILRGREALKAKEMSIAEREAEKQAEAEKKRIEEEKKHPSVKRFEARQAEWKAFAEEVKAKRKARVIANPPDGFVPFEVVA